MAAHRYWRIYITANTSGGPHLDISEIQMRTAIGGADVTGSGTASASSELSPFFAANAFDNNTATTWYTPAVNIPAWVKYDFGAGNDKDIIQVALTCWAAGEMARDFEVQYSDDNSTWTGAMFLSNEVGWSANETRLYSTSGTVTAKSSQVVVEVVNQPNPAAQSSQVVVEVVNLPDPNLQLFQTVAEVVRSGVPNMQLSQTVVEVIRANGASTPIVTARPQVFVCT